MSRIVLAYSGGLDTSVILKWLIEQGHEVIAFVADVGQKEDLEAVATKALAVGAKSVLVEDLKAEFVTDYIYPAIRAGAVYEGRYLLGTALARPLIAKKQIEVARRENAGAVAHGATGKGNDQVRFELACYSLAPEMRVISPWKTAAFLDRFTGRADMIRYAEENGIPIPVTAAKPYSTDANLMHISYEAGILEDPVAKPPEDMFRMTVSPQHAPDSITRVAIRFQGGNPVELQGATEPMSLFELANQLGGANGIGRIDIVENRYVGIKSRGVYETPGGTILWTAHQDLETLTLDREVLAIKQELSAKFARLVYNGYWFSPEMNLVREAIDATQRKVTGKVYLELYKGNATVVGRDSPCKLYDADLSSMDKEGGYDQRDAEGFIRINSLRLKASAQDE